MNDISGSDHVSRMKLLLGPSAPELTCDECFDYLDRYVELELSGEDADAAIPGMGPHLIGCPACGEDHDSLFALVSAVGADSAPPSA
ncbi:MAG: hypothetical protein WKF96_18645 [Solirubrobacteraceae bacterium]